MAEDTLTISGIGRHGATRLPSVDVDSFNIELKDDDGYLGDRASKGAFRKILDALREPLKKNGDDPLVSVRRVLEPYESSVIQEWWPDSRRDHRCGRTRTAPVTTAASCAIRAI
jgi:hypothetical protein